MPQEMPQRSSCFLLSFRPSCGPGMGLLPMPALVVFAPQTSRRYCAQSVWHHLDVLQGRWMWVGMGTCMWQVTGPLAPRSRNAVPRQQCAWTVTSTRVLLSCCRLFGEPGVQAASTLHWTMLGRSCPQMHPPLFCYWRLHCRLEGLHHSSRCCFSVYGRQGWVEC